MRRARSSGTPFSDERAGALVPGGPGLRRQRLGEAALDFREAGAEGADDRIEGPDVEVDIADEPDDAAHQEVLQGAVEPELQCARDLAVESVDRRVEIGEPERIARCRVGRRDRRRVRAGLVDEARHDRRTAAVDDRVGELRRDDLAPQAVARDGVREALAHLHREVALELACEIGIVRHAASRSSSCSESFA